MLAVTLLGAALFWRDSLAEVKSGVLASAAYVQNWWLIVHDQNYFASTGRPPPLQHLWSLAIEEQFYLLWPPVVLLIAVWLGRRHRVGIALIAAVGAIVSALWMAALAVHGNVPYDSDASRIYFGTDTHASALLLGCAAAAVVASRSRVRQTARSPRSRTGDVLGLAALAAFVWVLFTTNEFEPGLYRGGFIAVAALCTVVVVAATRRGSVLGRALDVAPMRWVGRRSYGIYLWHWPVFVVTRPVLDIALGAGALLVPRLAITVGIAALSYRFLEQPIRREGFRPWLRRVTGSNERGARRPAIALAARRARRRGRLRLRARAGRGLGGPAVPELRERHRTAAARRGLAPGAGGEASGVHDPARRPDGEAAGARPRDGDRRLGAGERRPGPAPGVPVPDGRRRRRDARRTRSSTRSRGSSSVDGSARSS